jgi:hypothetical protein
MNKVIIGECKHSRRYPFYNPWYGEKGSYCHDCGAKIVDPAAKSGEGAE